MINFQLSDPKVLVRRHSHKFSLRERKSHAFRPHNHRLVGCGCNPFWNRNNVKPRNVAMHRVQDYMTVCVLEVIGQFEFIERHQATHPLRTPTRRVMVGKGSDQTLCLVLCWPSDFPLGCAPAVPVLAHWNYGQDEAVLPLRVKTRQTISTIGEHATPQFGENHLSSTATELLPHTIILQTNTDSFESQHRRKVIYWI